MFDAKRLLDQFVGTAETYAGKENVDKVRSTIAKNPGLTKAAGIGLAAALLGTKSGRKLGKNALKLGGLALVGGLAYKAYSDWQTEKQSGTPHAGGGNALPAPPQGSAFEHRGGDAEDRAKAFLSAMIAAAKADGHIDAEERARIFEKLEELEDDSEARDFVMDQVMAPLDAGAIAALAHSQEQAVELYAASVMAITMDHPSERVYLDTLADKLAIEEPLARMVEKAVKEERQAV